MSTMSDCAVVRDAAYHYLNRGWHVLALKPHSKDPHPKYAPHAYLSATDCFGEIDEWFDWVPNLNIGIAARQSGLVIVDFDYRDAGAPAMRIMDELIDRGQDDTYSVITGNGFHLYYDATGIDRYPGKIVDGIDVKHNGYVVAAPSLHPSGATYSVDTDTTPRPFPTWLLEARR